MAERMATQPMVKVREIMKYPVIQVHQNESIIQVAKLMAKHEVGSVVVIDEENKPIGIITERDIVLRVFAKKGSRSKIKTSEVMSKPILTVDADVGIEEAAHQMSKLKVKRLLVNDNGEMAGIVSSRDIVAVTPALAQLLTEKAKLGIRPRALQTRPIPGGNCDNCGQWADYLKQVEGKLVCEECFVELEAETP